MRVRKYAVSSLKLETPWYLLRSFLFLFIFFLLFLVFHELLLLFLIFQPVEKQVQIY